MKLRKNPQDLNPKSYEEVIAVFAHAMHQILIDATRRKGAQNALPLSSPAKTSSLSKMFWQ